MSLHLGVYYEFMITSATATLDGNCRGGVLNVDMYSHAIHSLGKRGFCTHRPAYICGDGTSTHTHMFMYIVSRCTFGTSC